MQGSLTWCAVTHAAEQLLRRPAVTEYVAAAASKSDLERTELSKQKTGVFTGANVPEPRMPSALYRHTNLFCNTRRAFLCTLRLEPSSGCCHAGSYAVNPANAEEIPIWVADYVLGGYGSGAIMVRRSSGHAAKRLSRSHTAYQRGSGSRVTLAAAGPWCSS